MSQNVPTKLKSSTLIIRNPLMRISLEEPILCDLPLEKVTYELSSFHILDVLDITQKAVSVDFVIKELTNKYNWNNVKTIEFLLNDMFIKKIIILPEEYKNILPSLKHWEKRGWLEALVLHLSSRNIVYDDVKDDSWPLQAKNIFTNSPPEPDIKWLKAKDQIITLDLNAPLPYLKEDLEEVLLSRRSGKLWSQKPLTLQVLSSILKHANIEKKNNHEKTEDPFGSDNSTLLYSSYSALETWVFIFDVVDISEGIYQYNSKKHELNLFRAGNFRNELVKMCIGQTMAGSGSVAFIISAIWERYRKRYRHERSYRNLLINVAEFAHKYIISATAFGFSNFITPAFDDQAACKLIETTASYEAPLYMVAVG